MAISEENLQKYVKAGKIAAKIREQMRQTVTEGMPIIDICEKVESLTRENGARPAFPCNVSINEVAAHYSSPPQDKRIVPDNSIVKVDIGVHVDGYIADTAATICFNSDYENLASVTEKALETAVELLRPGLSIAKFGSTIQKSIEMQGFKPVSNLTGHQIGRYLVHSGKRLPNVSHISISKVRAGEVYGVEPFATLPKAAGKVRSGKEAHIFRLIKRKSLKGEHAKQLLKSIESDFRTLPFSQRWLAGYLPSRHYPAAFSELLSSRSLMAYPLFIEASGKPVAQAEHTVVITEDGSRVLT
ncbi:MAG: type II methionyl aminopeptidase [Candidatus Bathyarchaeota archaeon]|jgi:methionyl aminopeptidase